METIVRMKFGSHLYGTNTPTSDLDFKEVFIPRGRDIVLGNAFRQGKDVITNNTKTDTTVKNAAGDVDTEAYSLHKYLKLVAEGQTVALDMLFCPPEFRNYKVDKPWIFQEIADNKDKLICKKYMSFIGYCRTQANKYGIKGSRMGAARDASDVLAKFGAQKSGIRLQDYRDTLESLVRLHPEHIRFVTQIDNSNGQEAEYFEVCGRKTPMRADIKLAWHCYSNLYNEYGERARQALNNEGIDWKALSHAVRIGQQAVELLTTGNVIFPRPNAGHLLAIKQGSYAYGYVAGEIERLLERIEGEAARSVLRAEPDYQWIEDFILDTYGSAAYSDLGMREW